MTVIWVEFNDLNMRGKNDSQVALFGACRRPLPADDSWGRQIEKMQVTREKFVKKTGIWIIPLSTLVSINLWNLGKDQGFFFQGRFTSEKSSNILKLFIP